jgi:hypothetical protein
MVIARIKDGRIVGQRNLPDGLYEIKAHRKTRSDKQNKLLHGCVFPEASKAISEKTGRRITPEFAKSLLKTKFAVEHDSELGEYILPTSKMNTERCAKFIEDSVRWISKYCDYYIKLPDDWQGLLNQ